MKAALASMAAQGVKYLYGRWLIEGGPTVLLFDTGSMMGRLDEWKSDLWNLAGIPTPPNDSETNETVVFGYLVAWFLGEVGEPITAGQADITVVTPVLTYSLLLLPPLDFSHFCCHHFDIPYCHGRPHRQIHFLHFPHLPSAHSTTSCSLAVSILSTAITAHNSTCFPLPSVGFSRAPTPTYTVHHPRA